MNLAPIHIIEKPSLMLAPDTGVSEAIALMNQQRVSCALVVDNHQLVGLLTERDVVRMTAEAMEFNRVQVAAIMTRDPVRIVVSADLDIFSVLSTLRQEQIRHLPAIDESGNILGVITQNSIRQVLQPTDLLKIQQVAQVMSDRVIHLPQTVSLWEITIQMTREQVSCIVIVAAKNDSEPVPIGIITERDIVKFWALNLNLAEIVASEVMSTPLLPIKTGDSLWDAHQLMEENGIRRLVVVNEAGNLAGILTQTHLLEALDPIEMSRTLEVLKEQVNRREIELNQVNDRLQEEIARREQELQERSQLERELKAARAEAEAATNRVTNILESITDAFFSLDSNWRFTYINPQAELLFQRNPEELIGQSLWVEFPEARKGRFYKEYHRVVAENISREFVEFYPPMNRWFEIHAYPAPEGILVYFEDVTEQIQAGAS
ncbi:MAG: CBS domain-containing protein, partial [Chroococcales cyanobacterium]